MHFCFQNKQWLNCSIFHKFCFLFLRHKVKITPGSARRGKASKMVLQMFLKDKTLLAQEKDLIKAIKPDAAARNMPGKVKVSATQNQRK